MIIPYYALACIKNKRYPPLFVVIFAPTFFVVRYNTLCGQCYNTFCGFAITNFVVLPSSVYLNDK